NSDGYTVLAYTDKHLALFGPNSNVPIAEWGGRINAEWRSVAFEDQNASGKKGTRSIVAVSTTGETYSWQYFKNFEDLIKFADDHIPFYGSKKLELPSDELCKLALTKCNNIGG